jgi:hypothetical protein
MVALPLQRLPANPIPELALDAAGLVALADIEAVQERTVLTGTSTYLDIFVLCPGMHRQQHAPELNRGELPQAAEMQSGWVWRIENPATVVFLQKIGKTGHLVTLEVSSSSSPSWFKNLFWSPSPSRTSSVLYLTTAMLSLTSFLILVLLADWWGCIIISILWISRFVNVVIVRRRCKVGWHGVPKSGLKVDMLILLSQDRWVRMKGRAEDVQKVTAGQWMKDMSLGERLCAAMATMATYIDAALASNAKQIGKIIIVALLLLSAGLLDYSNDQTPSHQLFGCLIEKKEEKKYNRRLDMVNEMIQEHNGRDDWATRLWLILPDTKLEEMPAVRRAMTNPPQATDGKQDVSHASSEISINKSADPIM